MTRHDHADVVIVGAGAGGYHEGKDEQHGDGAARQ